MGQKLTELCGETDNSAMRAGAFNTDRTADRKINNWPNWYIENTLLKKKVHIIFKHKNTLTKLDRILRPQNKYQ